MKLTLIPDWRQAWKFASVQLATLFTLLSAAFEYLAFFPQYLPPPWVKYAFLAVLVGRMVTLARNKAPAWPPLP